MMDGDALTAAHNTLPLGTHVRVANLDNGRAVVVRINDRGPFAKDRIIDLSKAAAEALGMVADGVANVRGDPGRGRSRQQRPAAALFVATASLLEAGPHNTPSSWPGLSRPSNAACAALSELDARIKSGHDEVNVGGGWGQAQSRLCGSSARKRSTCASGGERHAVGFEQAPGGGGSSATARQAATRPSCASGASARQVARERRVRRGVSLRRRHSA